MAATPTTSKKIDAMHTGVNAIITTFLFDTTVYNENVIQYFTQIFDALPPRAIVRAAVFYTKLLDQYSALKLASWANNGSTLFDSLLEKKREEGTEYAKYLAKFVQIDTEEVESIVSPWWEELMKHREIIGPMMKQLVADMKLLLAPIYPDKHRIAAVDKALSEAGLPTSTENEESWWQRLLETPC